MSDSEELTPPPAETVSTPGADVRVPHTGLTGTATPPTTPAEIDLSGAVQVSERKQARREDRNAMSEWGDEVLTVEENPARREKIKHCVVEHHQKEGKPVEPPVRVRSKV